MKNYNKKLIVMFVMLLAIMGFGTIQNESIANAAIVGQQLLQPEDGWKRIDDKDNNISYVGAWNSYDAGSSSGYWNNEIMHTENDITSTCQFGFYGSELEIVQSVNKINQSGNISITIDGVEETYTSWLPSNKSVIVYQKEDLEKKVHEVVIKSNDTVHSLTIDCFDIDKDGYLLPYSESISLDESSIDLKIGESQQLTATTTPASIGVKWASSNPDVATVDSNGNVTAIKEGQTIITATINDGSNLSASCTVNVTKEDTTEPTDPEEPIGDGSLFIELVDGNIKSYDVTGTEIENFIDWYENRDLDDSQSPVYKFNKGDYKDYVVHDKIDWFEVR